VPTMVDLTRSVKGLNQTGAQQDEGCLYTPDGESVVWEASYANGDVVS
jgi:hypothetical protein